MRGTIRRVKDAVGTLMGRVRVEKEHESTPVRNVDGMSEQEALISMLLSGWNVTDSGLYYPRS